MMAKRSLRKSSKRLIYPQRELVLCLVSGFQLRCYPLLFGKAITPCYTLINFKTWEPEVLFSLFSHFTCAETSLNFTFFWPMLILPLWNKNSALWRWVFHSSPLIKSLESLKQAASPSKNTWGFREIQLLLPSHSSIDFYDIPSSFLEKALELCPWNALNFCDSRSCFVWEASLDAQSFLSIFCQIILHWS